MSNVLPALHIKPELAQKIIKLLNNEIFINEVSTDEVIEIHKSLKSFKNEDGPYHLKSRASLESTIEGSKQPYYDDGLKRVVEVWYRMTKNHDNFSNGNKRTATFLVINKIGLALLWTLVDYYIDEYGKQYWLIDTLVKQKRIEIENNLTEIFNDFFQNNISQMLEMLYNFSIEIADSKSEDIEIIKKKIENVIINIINSFLYFLKSAIESKMLLTFSK